MRISEEKKALRQLMIEKRGCMSPQIRKNNDEIIAGNIVDSTIWNNARTIFLYASLDMEVSTYPLIRSALEEGKTVGLPAINPEKKGEMKFYQYTYDTRLTKGKFGILEPERNIILDKPDLIIVPGLAFDLSGNRLGFGGGYYDRYLDNNPDRARYLIGLAYQFQILESLPYERHDCKMTWLCSERGIYETKSDLVSISGT